jgi:hypothetical protein
MVRPPVKPLTARRRLPKGVSPATRLDGVTVHPDRRGEEATHFVPGQFHFSSSQNISKNTSRSWTTNLSGASARRAAKSQSVPIGKLRWKIAPIDRVSRGLLVDYRGTTEPRVPYVRKEISRIKFLRYESAENHRFFKFSLTGGKLMCTIENSTNARSCYNKNRRVFGQISKDKHFRHLIKCLTYFGCNRNDLVSILRVRDLWVRKCRTYVKSVQSMLHRLPPSLMRAVCSGPLVGVSRV